MTDAEAAAVLVQVARMQERISALELVVRIVEEYPVPGKVAEAIRRAERTR